MVTLSIMLKSEYIHNYHYKNQMDLVQVAKVLPMSKCALQRVKEVFEAGDTAILVRTCWSGCPGHCADCI